MSMKVLLTGFTPFGGSATNMSYDAVMRLPDHIAGAEIVKAELPTVFGASTAALRRAIKAHRPDVVICVGQAGKRTAITPERVAINVNDARIPDNDGRQPHDEPVVPHGPAAYLSSLPIKEMVGALEAEGLPAQVSNTAGTFVCNHVMYGLLHMIETEFGNMTGGFIHVPGPTADNPTPAMSLDEVARGLEICVATAVKEKE